MSDGFIAADHTDANLVNSWGIARLPTSPWWVADNATGVSTVYDASGTLLRTVAIPGADGPAAPTGIVANTTPEFDITLDGTTAPARFIFAREDGTIAAWTVATPGTSAEVVIPNATTNVAPGAIYKGLALASTPSGARLYATNFHAGTVETYDGAFAPVSPAPPFVDPGVPAGYAPFGIRAIGGLVYVTYAQQDEDQEDDVPGKHHGFVSAFTEDGAFVRRIAAVNTLFFAAGPEDEAHGLFGRIDFVHGRD